MKTNRIGSVFPMGQRRVSLHLTSVTESLRTPALSVTGTIDSYGLETEGVDKSVRKSVSMYYIYLIKISRDC